MRYVTLTRESVPNIGLGQQRDASASAGRTSTTSTTSRFRATDVTRAAVGAKSRLWYDWLNPNNGQPGSGWFGPFYSPVGAYVQLRSYGFTITATARRVITDSGFEPDGTVPAFKARASCASEVGYANDNQIHIVKRLDPGNLGHQRRPDQERLR